MQEATWYIGPLGDMRPLVVPEPGLEISQVRYGGIHQSLSGARTMDITGYRSEYKFDFKHLDQSEYLWLEALHSRLVPGPFYLIDPMKRNRLTQQASSMRPTNYSNSGVTFDSPYSLSRSWPSDIAVPGRSLELSGWAGTSLEIVFDQSKPVPILSGETMTAHVRMEADQVYTNANLRMSWYDEDQVFISNTDVPIDIGTTWAIHWFTYHEAPRNAAAVTFKIVLGSAVVGNKVRIAAPMVEAGVTWPSSWEIGGGAPLVLLDQLPTVSQRFPLRNASLTLLEA